MRQSSGLVGVEEQLPGSVVVSAEVIAPQLSREEARALTDRAQRLAADLWRVMRRLYEGGAHLALGYPSWDAYFQEELRQPGEPGGRSYAYKLLRAAEVEAEVSVHVDTRGMHKTQALYISASVKDPEERRDLVARVERVGGFDAVSTPRMRAMLQEMRGQRRVVELPEGTAVAWNPDVERQARQALRLLVEAAGLLGRANRLGHWVLPDALRALPPEQREEVGEMVSAARRDVSAAIRRARDVQEDLDRAAQTLGLPARYPQTRIGAPE